MGTSIEVSGKRVSDAINEGLETLNKTIDEVEVKILSQGGLFRKAKVVLTVLGEKPPADREKTVRSAPVAKEEPPRAKEDFVKKEKAFRPPVKPQCNVHNAAIRPEPSPTGNHDGETKPERREEERVKAPVTDEIVSAAKAYLVGLLEKMNVSGEVTERIENNELLLNIKTDSGIVIGYRGETLDAIEYLVSIAVNKYDDKYFKVIVNSNNYREKRTAVLQELAVKMANKCIRTNHKVILEPMNSSGRRIIHATLADNDKVTTRSEGHEPNRHVVILAVRSNK